jgi:hypothetical protein
MQNAYVASRPQCHLLSNGALVLAEGLILCTHRKMDQTIH